MKIEKNAVLDIINKMPTTMSKQIVADRINSLPASEDEELVQRLFSMAQTNTALCNKLKLYIDKYGEVL